MSFLNKGLQLINMCLIFNDPSVNVYFPIDIKFDDPTVAYLLNDQKYLILIDLFTS